MSSGWLAILLGLGALVGVLSLDDVLGAMATEWSLIARLVHNEREREMTGSVPPPLSV